LFFRAPAGLRNPFLYWALTKTGLKLAAWTRRGLDTRTPDADTVFKRLSRDLRPWAILLLHDRNCARTPDGTPDSLAVHPRPPEAAARVDLRFVTLHELLQAEQQ